MKIATGNRINEFWEELKGVLVPKSKVLKTLEEIDANTNEENIAGATALKEVNNKLAHGRVEIVVNDDGSLGYKLDGADTVYPFSGLGWFDKLSTGSHTFNIGSGTYTRTYSFPTGSNVLAIYGFYVGGNNSGNLNVDFNRANQSISFSGTTSAGFYLTVRYIRYKD